MPCVWSACSWVNSTPSSAATLASSNCSRRSGDVSTSTRRLAVGPCALDQHRAAPPAVLRIVGIAGAPAERRTRHAAGRSAAQDRDRQRHAAPPISWRGTLLNSRKKFVGRLAGDLVERYAARSRPAPWRSRPRKTARCACRGTCPAQDTAHRSRPGCDRPAGLRRSRADARSS